MATVSDSVKSSSSAINTAANSPRLGGGGRTVWANIVRGESDSVPAAPSSASANLMIPVKDEIPDSSSSNTIDISAVEAPPDISVSVSEIGNGNASKSKKPAWTKPSNSSAAVDVSPLMGSVSWPALADSAKASPKSSSDSLKTLPDGSASVIQLQLQGAVAGSSQQKPVQGNANPNSTTGHQFPARQKSFRRNQAGGSSNGGSPRAQPPNVDVSLSHNISPKNAGSSPREGSGSGSHKNHHNWEGGQKTGMVSQSSSGTDHQQQRNSYRRGGGGGVGGHHRGDGSNHHNHGNRRDQDRANHDSNASRGFNGRDGNMQQQQRVNQRSYVRPMPPSTASFISQTPVRPFANPMGFPEMPSPMYIVPTPPPESLRGVPYFHPPVMFLPPALDPQLPAIVAKQIEYYFSPDNLCKDIYLRKHMDIQGWVPVSLIKEFNRVKQWTSTIGFNHGQFILDSVRASTIVEVQGDKIRKRNDWMNWILPSQPASPSDALATSTNHDVLANHIQSIGLEGNSANGDNGKGPGDAHQQPSLVRSSSDDLNNGERQGKVQY